MGLRPINLGLSFARTALDLREPAGSSTCSHRRDSFGAGAGRATLSPDFPDGSWPTLHPCAIKNESVRAVRGVTIIGTKSYAKDKFS